MLFNSGYLAVETFFVVSGFLAVLSLVPALEKAAAPSLDKAAQQLPPSQLVHPSVVVSSNGGRGSDSGTQQAANQHPNNMQYSTSAGGSHTMDGSFVRQLLVARKYVRRRIWRICPAFYATLLVVLLLIAPDFKRQDGLPEAARNLLTGIFNCK